MNYSDQLSAYRIQVEDYLNSCFRSDCNYETLLSAMRYSLLAGGKRLRPVLMMAFCKAAGGDPDQILPAAASIEMLHTYSLIHDDLPCMDNDDYRRGKLTCHKVYGDDIATLAGDALLTAAFSTLASTALPADRVLHAVQILAASAGEHGMVAGQTLDLINEGKSADLETLREIDRHKTGDLIRGACTMGVALAGGNAQKHEAADRYAAALGIAFQIRDDILDVTGTQEILGKPIGSDIENDKSTYVSLLGLEACQALVTQETQNAIDALEGSGLRNTGFLIWLAGSLVDRNK